MIARIIDFSVRRRAFVFLAAGLLCVLGWLAMARQPVDALPDLSETQVIVQSRWDRSPGTIEDQVTYPIVTALEGAPKVKAVRGISDFGSSYVYVIFEEKTDLYWARARTMEYLAGILPTLPSGVKTTLGPDATGLGWVYQYALVDDSHTHDLAQLRSIQDWYLRFHLRSVPGVSEVASLGGYGKQFQVNVDPRRLQALGIGMNRIVDAVRQSNSETGGKVIEVAGSEHMVRGLGYAQTAEDLADSVIFSSDNGTPIRVRDVASVQLGPELRRGVTDWNGAGEAVSGIVVMRQGENALAVINRVKKRLGEVSGGLPKGVRVVPIYDRSKLIEQAVHDTWWTIAEVVFTVALVIFFFLGHLPSALIPAITIPVTVLLSFIPLQAAGYSANIMLLGGIAIAIGALVDAAILVVEQSHKRLEEWQSNGQQGKQSDVILAAIKEVSGPSFFTLLVIGVSFLPVLALDGQEGKLFQPLAISKTIAMVTAALLAITLDPALRITLSELERWRVRPRWLRLPWKALIAGPIRPERAHPVSRFLIQSYEPVVRWSLRHPRFVLVTALAIVLSTIPVFLRLGSEFLPSIDEGTLLYMPSTMPGISVTEAKRLVQTTDAVITQFPEVAQVFGKAGRADSPTDPAPLSMLETIITLKPKSQWRRVHTWYSDWAPDWLRPVLVHVTSDRIDQRQLIQEMNEALQVPGLTNSWTMPIRGRVDMLTTGIRTPLGLKIQGPDSRTIQELAERATQALKSVAGARSVFAERAAEGLYLDVKWNRAQLARYGITIEQAQASLASSIGGDDVTTVIDGRARYPVNVRYLRTDRTDYDAIRRVLVPAAEGKRQVPLSELAAIETTKGPSMLRNEDGALTGYVYIDYAGRDMAGFIRDAKKKLSAEVTILPGYSLRWTGQYEAMEATRERLKLAIPLTLLVIVGLLWLNTKSMAKVCIVLLAVPFSAAGAFWLLYCLGYSLSVAVWIGLIALLGVDAETGTFMLLYLDLSLAKASQSGLLSRKEDLHEAIVAGAARRIRPKFMTVATMLFGLLPVLWSTGAGSEVMKRVAAPMIGGIATSFLLELLVYPVLYESWKRRTLLRHSPFLSTSGTDELIFVESAVTEKAAPEDSLATSSPWRA